MSSRMDSSTAWVFNQSGAFGSSAAQREDRIITRNMRETMEEATELNSSDNEYSQLAFCKYIVLYTF